jgi:hypothetical protein
MIQPAKTRAPKFMLELYYHERRTLADFRRGLLGPYFDGFAGHLKAREFSAGYAREVLGKCCQFNYFLLDRGITHCRQLRESLLDAFLELYLADTRTTTSYSPRGDARRMLKLLLHYLTEIRVFQPPKPKLSTKPYSWVLNPYLQHLHRECELSEVTIQRARVQVGSFLESLGQKARRARLKSLPAETIEGCIKQHLRVRLKKHES